MRSFVSHASPSLALQAVVLRGQRGCFRQGSASCRPSRHVSRSEVSSEWSTPGDQHFVHEPIPDDLLQLIFDLPAKRFQPRFRSAPKLLRIELGYDRTNTILNQGFAVLN